MVMVTTKMTTPPTMVDHSDEEIESGVSHHIKINMIRMLYFIVQLFQSLECKNARALP